MSRKQKAVVLGHGWLWSRGGWHEEVALLAERFTGAEQPLLSLTLSRYLNRPGTLQFIPDPPKPKPSQGRRKR